MDAPTRRRHRIATVDVSATTGSEGASTMEITTICLDLAKNVVQVPPSSSGIGGA